MKHEITESIDAPQGVHVTLANGIFHVKGAKGEISKELHSPRITAKVHEGKIEFHASSATQREKKLIMTFIAHLKCMFKGVQEGYVYKLKICASHFPMTVAVKGTQLEVKNFFGEQVARFTQIPQGVTAKVDGQIIVLEGINKELVGQTAAKIEASTKRPGFDKRSFQDGIFIIEKDGEVIKA